MNTKALRFLADESCDFGVVRILRDSGYDVLAVREYMQRSDDASLSARAAHLDHRGQGLWLARLCQPG